MPEDLTKRAFELNVESRQNSDRHGGIRPGSILSSQQRRRGMLVKDGSAIG